MFAIAMNNGNGFNLESILDFAHYCHATRSENMLKYWAKSKTLLLHVSTQQKIVAQIRVLPTYSQTLPK